ncbi:hypothetical protein QR680_000462 [Steinernema hermaphroditum]|uniref:DUF3677 domain-containing protein n=1 Tax=Steinernema hermaphroditum TaxID=289476 RepID=A0AA39LEB8_9BILA|nr:hypothetical protein QR680_000462 [Steinernema hermaphroditum]
MPPPSRLEKIKGKAASQLFTLGKPSKDSGGASTSQQRPPKRPLPNSSANDTSPSTSAPHKKKRLDPRLSQRAANATAASAKPVPQKSVAAGAPSLFSKGGAFSIVGGGAKNRVVASGTSVDVVGGGRVGSIPSSSSYSTASVSSLLNDGVFSVDLQSWKKQCADVQFSIAEFSNLAESAKAANDSDQLAKVVCCALKTFENHSAPISSVVSTLCALFGQETDLASKQIVQSALFSTLHTLGTSADRERHSERIGYVITLLESALSHLDEWPIEVVSLAVADSLDKRGWIDHSTASALVPKIFSAFGTCFPSEEMISAAGIPIHWKRCGEGRTRFKNHSKEISCMRVKLADILEKCLLQRESAQKEAVSKNAIRTMSVCCGFSDFRAMATKRLDAWLLNAKLQRCAIELFMFLACNVGSEGTEGYMPLMKFLTHMKSMSSKQISNIYMVVIKEIIQNDQNAIAVLAGYLMDGEFSDHKSGYSMPVLQHLFTANQRITRKVMAEKFVRMVDREEHIRQLRTFMKEFVRTYLRSEFSFAPFVEDLLNAASKRYENEHMPRIFFQGLIDTVCSLPFLGFASTTVKHVLHSRGKGTATSSQVETITRLSLQFAEFFTVCIEWLKTVQVEDGQMVYVPAFYKVLYLNQHSDYYWVGAENGPTEQDLSTLMKLIAEAPIKELLVESLFSVGLSDEAPIDGCLVLDLLWKLTSRVLQSNDGFTMKGGPLVSASKAVFVDNLFRLCVFRGDPQRPLDSRDQGRFSIKEAYWKAWMVALVWCYMNRTILPIAYEKYSTLRMIIQFSVTKDYSFPPPSFGQFTSAEKIAEAERTTAETEGQAIVDMEASCWKVPATVENSRFINRLCFNDPTGPIRAPTEEFLAELRNINVSAKGNSRIGVNLCQCRSPDILLDLIKDQGAQRAMPSITEIATTSGQAIHHLPLLCLAQISVYCIANSESIGGNGSLSEENMESIGAKLKHYLGDANSSVDKVKELVFYLVKQLGAPTAIQRNASVRLLRRLLGNTTDSGVLSNLSDVVHFDEMKHDICMSLASEACSVESSARLLIEYITFIRNNLEIQAWHEVATKLSLLVDHSVESQDAVHEALMDFYADYVNAARTGEGKIDWSFDSTTDIDRLRVKFADFTVSLTAPAVSAMTKLLCSAKQDCSVEALGNGFTTLMQLWFPTDESKRPVVEKYDESGELTKMELLPADLKKKMLCANDERVASVALEGIDTAEALRFIRVFGLSLKAARKLLEIIESGISGVTDLNELKKAAPFIESYSADVDMDTPMFADRFKLLSTDVKKEGDIQEVPAVVNFVPFNGNARVEDVDMREICEFPNEKAVEEFMEEAIGEKQMQQSDDRINSLGGNQSPKWANFMVAVSTDPQVAQWALSALDKRLTPFLERDQVDLLVLLMRLMDCAAKSSDLAMSFGTFAEKVEKMSEAPAFIISTLRKLHSKPMKPQFGFRRSVPDAQGKAGIDLSILDADATLRKLIDIGGTGQPRTVFRLNDFDINRLINHYVLLCPEIVDHPASSSENSAAVTKIRQMFASSSDAVHRLILVIPHRAKKSAIEFVYETVLSGVDERLNVPFVLDFVGACVLAADVEARCLPNAKQTAIFVEYFIVELMQIAANTSASKREQSTLKRLTANASVLEIIIAESKQKDDVIQQLLDLFNAQLLKLPASVEDERKLEAVKRIVSKLASIFPVFALNDASLLKNEISPPTVENMATHDRNMHQLILDMFVNYEKTNDQSANGKAYLEKLMNDAKNQPSVFVRHIPLLISKLYTVSQLPMGVKRMKDVGYYDVFVFILRAIVTADPESFETEADMHKVFEFYFEYFKNKISKTKSAYIELVKVLADVCLLYMERCKATAQDYLLKKITYLIEMKKYCHDYVALRLIIDSLPNCPEKQALANQQSRPRDHYQRDPRDRRDYYKR